MANNNKNTNANNTNANNNKIDEFHSFKVDIGLAIDAYKVDAREALWLLGQSVSDIITGSGFDDKSVKTLITEACEDLSIFPVAKVYRAINIYRYLTLDEWVRLSTLCSESVLVETIDKADKLSEKNMFTLLAFIANEALPCNPKFRAFLKDVVRTVKGTDTAFNSCLLTDKQLASIYKNARAKTLAPKTPNPKTPKAPKEDPKNTELQMLRDEINSLKTENKKLKESLKVEKFLSQGLTLKAEEAEKMLLQRDSTNRQLSAALETKETALKALRDRNTQPKDRLASLKNGNGALVTK